MEVCLYTYYLFYCSISLTFPCGSTEKFAQRVCTKCVTVVRERERESEREGGRGLDLNFRYLLCDTVLPLLFLYFICLLDRRER